MELARELPAVEADATQLRQIVMNLTCNAAEATGDTSSEVVVRTGLAQCSRQDLDGLIADEDLDPGTYVYVEVEDSGCGIEEATLHHIFDPFFSTKLTGRGFGLAAVRGIARSHRAALDVSTQVGKGTRVRVLFPGSDATIKLDCKEPPESDPIGTTGTVLVVDDEPHVLEVMKRALGRAGYEVLTASDGADALTLFEERYKELQAVVLDMTMPGFNGKEAYERMRGIAAAVPIVLASGYTEEEVIERVGEANAPLFLQKPFQSKELLHAVESAIRATN
jgi:CheY-like chemotaxis protein